MTHLSSMTTPLKKLQETLQTTQRNISQLAKKLDDLKPALKSYTNPTQKIKRFVAENKYVIGGVSAATILTILAFLFLDPFKMTDIPVESLITKAKTLEKTTGIYDQDLGISSEAARELTMFHESLVKRGTPEPEQGLKLNNRLRQLQTQTKADAIKEVAQNEAESMVADEKTKVDLAKKGVEKAKNQRTSMILDAKVSDTSKRPGATKKLNEAQEEKARQYEQTPEEKKAWDALQNSIQKEDSLKKTLEKPVARFIENPSDTQLTTLLHTCTTNPDACKQLGISKEQAETFFDKIIKGKDGKIDVDGKKIHCHDHLNALRKTHQITINNANKELQDFQKTIAEQRQALLDLRSIQNKKNRESAKQGRDDAQAQVESIDALVTTATTEGDRLVVNAQKELQKAEDVLRETRKKANARINQGIKEANRIGKQYTTWESNRQALQIVDSQQQARERARFERKGR